jgi:anti-sigma factor RsiW
MKHLTEDRLDAYCDGSLASEERAAADAHVAHCSQCRAEVEDWRAVAAALAALPRLAPRKGFADRVMARVRIRQPWHARAGALVARAVPRTTPGWAFAASVLSVPVLFVGGFAAWLLSKSYVTAQGLWIFATDRFADGANQVASGAMSSVLNSDIAAWLVTNLTRLFDSAGARGVGAIAAASAMVVAVSAWVLYRYLFRSPARSATHATSSH